MGSLVEQVQDSLDHHTEELTSLRRDLESALSDRLADVHVAIEAANVGSAGGLRDLEERVVRRDEEVAELREVLAALDSGMGHLRAEIADVKVATEKAVAAPAEAANEQGRPRRTGRKTG